MDRFALFSTPVIVHHLQGMDDVNRELTERLIVESEHDAGFQRSNVGGWHSVPNLSQRPEPCYRALMEQVVRHVRITFQEVAAAVGAAPSPLDYRYAVHGWAMVMRDGDYTILHDHAESHWSLAYYADAGDADFDRYPMSGHLSFVDPGRGARAIPGVDLFPSTFSVKPHTSAMVIFPGWLQHYVHAYRGTRPRVCISCNIKLEPVMPGGGPPAQRN